MRYPDLINALLLVSAGLCLSAWGLFLSRKEGAARVAYACGWALTLALLVLNGVLAQAPPLGNMYQVQVLLALCFLPAHLALRLRYGLGWTAPYFAVASALPLIGALFMDKDIGWRRMPALQSPWFVPHVTAYIVSYSLSAVAFAMTIVKLARWRRPGGTDPRYDPASRQVLRLAFPFMTFGLLSGALWADSAWGAYWSWDPKETWSLITWTLYAICLHVQTRPGLRRYADVSQVLAFAALLVTFIVVNVMPRFASALHGYA